MIDQAQNLPGTGKNGMPDSSDSSRSGGNSRQDDTLNVDSSPQLEAVAVQGSEPKKAVIQQNLDSVLLEPSADDSVSSSGNSSIFAAEDPTKSEIDLTIHESPNGGSTQSAPSGHNELTIGVTSNPNNPEETIHYQPDSSENDQTLALSRKPVSRKQNTAFPKIFGYEVLGELGRGGMGVVYKARQFKLKRTVALKMVLSGAHASEEQLTRFLAEAEAVAQLQHPNIVQIYEIGEHDNLPFFSLEYVDGGTLTKLIDGKPMAYGQAAEMAELLALAMASAHQQGIIHRDLKPANILLSKDGLPKITDFGLAKKLEGDSTQTKEGSLMGTPSYMAPEQAKGDTREIGPLADVYALGVILYEMLVGRPPFIGSSIMETLQQVQNLEPVHPRDLVPKIPIDLETICLKCLQKEPGKRYQSAENLAGDLHRFLAGEPILARPVGKAERLYRWCKRNPGIASLTAAIALLLVAISIGSVSAAFYINKQKDLAERARDDAEESKLAAQLAEAEAEANEKIADNQAGLALKALGTLVDDVQKEIGDTPGLQGLKKKLLVKALEELVNVTKGENRSALQNRRILLANIRMADLYRETGQGEEANKLIQKCYDLSTALYQAYPDRDLHKENQAVVLSKMGQKVQSKDPKDALTYYERALSLYQDLIDHPQPAKSEEEKINPVNPLKLKSGLGETYTRIGAIYLFSLQDFAKAADHFEKALTIRRDLANLQIEDIEKTNQLIKEATSSSQVVAAGKDSKEAVAARFAAQTMKNEFNLDLARAYDAVGLVNLRLNQGSKTFDSYKESLKIREAVVNSNPDNPKFKRELSTTYANLIDFSIRTKNPAKGEEVASRYLELNQSLVKKDPLNMDYQVNLGRAFQKLALLALNNNDKPKAKNYLLECKNVKEIILNQDPNNFQKQKDLLEAIARCGEHGRANIMADKIRKEMKKDDIGTIIVLATTYAQCAGADGISSQEKEKYTTQAVADLNKAVGLGFKDLNGIETDIDMVPIKNDPGFKSFLENFRKKLATSTPKK